MKSPVIIKDARLNTWRAGLQPLFPVDISKFTASSKLKVSCNHLFYRLYT